MVLIKNVVITSIGDQYLKAQQDTIFTNVVDEAPQICFFKLHNELSTTKLALKM
jgi:hypothetical protein